MSPLGPSCLCAVSFALLLFLRPLCAQSDAPVHYYDAAIGKTGPALKAALQSIIRGHVMIPYTANSTDTWDALKALDQDVFNPSNVVLVYSGLTAAKSEQYNGSTGSWDREHLWPQSFGITAYNGNSRAKSDLFNLRPINTTVNSARGNKFYDDSAAPIFARPDAPGSTYDSDSWEPRDADKGAIARAMFYMAVRYDGTDADVPDLELSDTPSAAAYRFGKLTTLLAWHRQLAVDAAERARNARIYADYQHNRNPFIDHPEYAEMVFLNRSPMEAWRETHFTDAQLTYSAISGDDADPDHDGVGNLLEYFFGGDPLQPENGPPLTAVVTSQSGSYSLVVSYMRNRHATDIALSYERATELQSWTGVTPQVIDDSPISSELEQVTVRFPASAEAYSVRLRAAR